MEVVEIWCEAETFDGAFDVRLDVFGRVGDAAIFEAGESTFGRDCRVQLVHGSIQSRDVDGHTEDLIANVVLPDEVSQELFVDASLVDNL